MRIGINALYLIPGKVGGTEIYLRSLLTALALTDDRHEYFVYANEETGPDLAPGAPNFHFVQTGVPARLRPLRILYEQFALPVDLRRDGIKVLLNAGFTSPVSFAGRSVTVFHDLQHKRHPEFFRWFDLPFWNLLLGLSARRSRWLIAVSRATARDLVRFYPSAKGRIAVIPHGVDPEFFRVGEKRSAENRQEPFLLTVSTLHPHKNIHRLLEAFAEFRKSRPEFRLVVAGLTGFATEELLRRTRELRLSEFVRFTGWIPREDLYSLFERAWAYIAPSEFEGFGMPVIEALAAGLPTACSSIEPFDEVAGTAAIRFSAESVQEMVQAIGRIICDEPTRARAPVEGPAKARQFDWQRTAAHVLRLLIEASG